MRLSVAVVAAVGMLAAQGGSTAKVRVWKAAEIHDRGQALGKKLDAQKVASETTDTQGNRSFMVAHREGSGQAEVHDAQADIMFISEGEITMVYGGTVVGGKTTAPGETRGASIQGGTEVRLGPGDVLHIPAKVPHQMKLAPGKQVTYFVAKVVE
jgi:mannose-6-phosphate isomerase-like protein (cupin superfamily)